MEEALLTLIERWGDEKSIHADVRRPWTPYPINVTLSALDYPVPGKIDKIRCLLERLGCSVTVLAKHRGMTPREIDEAAKAFNETDAHIVVMTSAWLTCPWSAIELVRCIEEDIPSLALVYANPTSNPMVSHCLKAIPCFDAQKANVLDLRRRIADVVQQGHLHYEARNSL